MSSVLIAALIAGCCEDRDEATDGSRTKEKCDIMTCRKIGTIRSPYTPDKETPRQGRLAPDVESRIEIDREYEQGLKDIESFSHLIILYAFDRAPDPRLLVQTPWDDKLHGVFATRSPRRPSPIGMTVVKLTSRSGCVLHVQGLDAFDGTAVLDIKPYLPRFDSFADANQGWSDRGE